MVKRLRLANDEPLGIQTFYIPKYTIPDFLQNDLTQSLYSLSLENTPNALGFLILLWLFLEKSLCPNN